MSIKISGKISVEKWVVVVIIAACLVLFGYKKWQVHQAMRHLEALVGSFLKPYQPVRNIRPPFQAPHAQPSARGRVESVPRETSSPSSPPAPKQASRHNYCTKIGDQCNCGLAVPKEEARLFCAGQTQQTFDAMTDRQRPQ